LIDELVPRLAAVVDEIVVGFEDTVGEPVIAAMIVMSDGTTRRVDRCQPA
jgi:hypothetical protein